MVERWKVRVRTLKTELHALYLAYRDPRVSWYARALAALVVAYAFSPIDLIPDPIPVLGYLDDLILLPLGVGLTLRLIPAGVMDECRAQARSCQAAVRPVQWLGAVIVVGVWLGLILAAIRLLGA